MDSWELAIGCKNLPRMEVARDTGLMSVFLLPMVYLVLVCLATEESSDYLGSCSWLSLLLASLYMCTYVCMYEYMPPRLQISHRH